MTAVDADVVSGVQQAFGRYIHALDRGTVEECLDCFAPDAVIESAPAQDDAIGHDAIRARLEGIIEHRNPFMRHLLSTLVVTGHEGDLATAVVYFDRETMYETAGTTDFGESVEAGTVARHACRYEATLTQGAGVWRFERLAIRWAWTDTQRALITPSSFDRS